MSNLLPARPLGKPLTTKTNVLPGSTTAGNAGEVTVPVMLPDVAVTDVTLTLAPISFLRDIESVPASVNLKSDGTRPQKPMFPGSILPVSENKPSCHATTTATESINNAQP